MLERVKFPVIKLGSIRILSDTSSSIVIVLDGEVLIIIDIIISSKNTQKLAPIGILKILKRTQITPEIIPIHDNHHLHPYHSF